MDKRTYPRLSIWTWAGRDWYVDDRWGMESDARDGLAVQLRGLDSKAEVVMSFEEADDRLLALRHNP